jgi:hypothetical protein
MAKYPVEYTDAEGIVDGLNYVLSGPSGLGQNFAGFSSSTTGYLTGNFRVPYVEATPTELYVPDIALSSGECLDPRTVKYTFTTPQATPPFRAGNTVETFGFADDFYNQVWSPIGVVECTTTYFIGRLRDAEPSPEPDLGGGFVYYTSSNTELSTDCNARVTVTGGTDRVFINAQLDSVVSYVSEETSPLNYTVRVNRYRGIINNDPVNPDYIFDLDGDDAVVAEKTYFISSLEPTTGQVLGLTVTGGTNHVSRTTYKSNYSVIPEVTSGSGSLLALDVELKPAIATSSTGLSSGGPYFAPVSTGVPYRTEPWNFKTPTAVAESGGILTITVDNSTTPFVVGQSVKLTGADPYNGTYKITAATATYIEVETTVTGTATLVDPEISSPFFNTAITIQGGGTGFAVGDTLLIKGSQIGGVDGTNDMTLEVTGVSDNTPVTLPDFDTVFTSIIDVPGPGYYWYILEVTFDTLTGSAELTTNQFNYRGLSAQVVKE